MDTILSIETSTPHGSVALYRYGRPVDVREFVSDRGHNSAVFPPLESLLREAGDELDLIVVGTGPGSYSGIRVGISTAIGISVARDVPLIGIPSLCALPAAFPEERYAVAGNARRGAWWYVEVERGRMSTPIAVGEEEQISSFTRRWPGHLFTTDDVSPPFCTAQPAVARADVLAARAGALTVEACDALILTPPEPLYLRAPFVTHSKKPVFR